LQAGQQEQGGALDAQRVRDFQPTAASQIFAT